MMVVRSLNLWYSNRSLLRSESLKIRTLTRPKKKRRKSDPVNGRIRRTFSICSDANEQRSRSDDALCSRKREERREEGKMKCTGMQCVSSTRYTYREEVTIGNAKGKRKKGQKRKVVQKTYAVVVECGSSLFKSW